MRVQIQRLIREAIELIERKKPTPAAIHVLNLLRQAMALTHKMEN